MPVLKAPFPLRTDDVRFVLETLHARLPPPGRAAYPRDEIAAELAESGLLALDVHKRRERYTHRWMHGRAHGDADRVRGHADDRGRVRGRGPGVGGGARARAVRSPCDVRGARVEGARPVRRAALRRHRRRHQLGQVPRRRARCGRRVPARRRPGRGHPAGRGARADGTARRGADRAHRRRDRGHGRRRRPPGGGGPRRGRHRRAAHRAQRGRAPRRRAHTRRRRDRGDPRRGGGPLAYLAAVRGLAADRGPTAVFDSGGGSTQFTFGDGARVDERFSVNVGAVSITERYGLARGRLRGHRRRRAARDRRRPRAPARPAGARRDDRDGRHRHEPRRGPPRARSL